MRKATSIMLGAVVFCVFGAQRAFCADLVGLVTDAQGHPVAAVKVMVRDAADKVLSEAQTDASGQYRITGLTSGTYNYVLDPLASGFKGGAAAAYLDSKGLTINWKVSASSPAIALASEGTEIALAGDPFGMEWPAFLGVVGGAIGAVSGGVVGGYAAAGGFSAPSSPSR
jgi:hypothetical protein